MKIWVDSDACPVQIRDLIVRAAHKRKITTIFIANKKVPLLESQFVSFVVVNSGPDVADAYIEEQASAGNLVITQDIPLAALLVPKGVCVINPRGTTYDDRNIADLLSRRDLMTELRDIGAVSTTTPPLDAAAVRAFANSFDSAVQRLSRQAP